MYSFFIYFCDHGLLDSVPDLALGMRLQCQQGADISRTQWFHPPEERLLGHMIYSQFLTAFLDFINQHVHQEHLGLLFLCLL